MGPIASNAKFLSYRRAPWGVLCIALSLAVGCGKSCGGQEGGAGGAQTGSTASDQPGDRPSAFANLKTHLDLLELAHLCDIDHEGLYIDFGTPARAKYTVGRWKTGWGTDGSTGGVTFTRVGATGRVYFPVDREGPITLRLRVHAVGSRNLSLYVNGNAYNARFEEGAGFRDYDVHVAADHVVVGENHLLLRFGGVEHVGDEDVAAEVDSIRVIAGEPPAESYSPPEYARLVDEVRIGDVTRRAIAVRAGTRLSWYVQVPHDGKIGFSVGAEGSPPARANAKVVVTPEGGEAKELFVSAAAGTWNDQAIDIGSFEGQIVRLDLVADGQGGAGRVAWGTPAILVPPPEPTPPPRRAKNVVVVLIDTMRADKLRPFNPRTRVRTPAIDALAQAGTAFTFAHSPENWTKPSVASVLTSLWPASHQTKTDEARLPDAATLVSEVYKEAGFSTATFLANGYVSDRFGFGQGWDHYTNFIREKKSTQAEVVFREAGDWIEQHKTERFFVYVQTIDPHVPYDPPAEFLQMYDAREYTGAVQPRLTADQLERAKRNPPEMVFDANDRRRLEALYDGEVSYHDKYLGEFVERLRSIGVFEDTLFVITSDHGEEFQDHGSWGHGHTLYEELLHVPLLFRMNGAIPAQQSLDMPVSTVDLAPTILEATGVRVPDVMEGRSLLGAMRGDARPGPAVAFSDFLDDRRAIHTGRWKLILRGINPTLFDLQNDPGETHELTPASHPIAMRYCRVLLGQFLGASDRRDWLSGRQQSGTTLREENAEMDETLRNQLNALGYVQGSQEGGQEGTRGEARPDNAPAAGDNAHP